jgi:hypothetical protein
MPVQQIKNSQIVTTGVSATDVVYNPNTISTADAIFIDQDKTKVDAKYPIYKNCYKMDEQLKLITDELSIESKKLLENSGKQKYVKALQGRKNAIEYAFNSASCRDVIETDRLKESAIIETQGAINQEKSVLGKTKNEESIYIAVGAVVVLVGLYMFLKK